MNKTLIFRKIGGIISEITEQYQYLAESPENINPLELELFIANSHFLSEHLAILKKLENTTDIPTPLLTPHQEPTTEANYPVEEVNSLPINEEPEVINEPEPVTETAEISADQNLRPAELENRPGEIVNSADHQQVNEYEPTLDNHIGYHSENTGEEQNVSESPAEETKVEGVKEDLNVLSQEVFQPVNNVQTYENKESKLFEEEKVPNPSRPVNNVPTYEDKESKALAEEKVPTLNEILAAGKSNENMAAKISRTEDKDLRSMIKLNDKLMFVRDLFNGYSLAYSEAIDMVNRFDNFKSAENFLLQNYAVKNRWAEKQQTVDQFYEVLNKRFS